MFDWLTRSLAESRSRRGALRGFAAALGLATTLVPAIAETKKHRNKKKPKKNAFGCLDIGKKCNGKNTKCCSGICKGKRPKKGKKDKSQCVAHNAGPCRDDEDSCLQGEIQCGTGDTDAICLRTTGKASFCGLDDGGGCVDCARDTDCEPQFGPGAACVVCDDCQATGGTACYTPGA